MTDKQMENTQGTTPQPSGAASGASSALDVEAIVKALTPHIETIVSKQTQSVKDKRFAGLQGEIDGFKSQLAQLKSLQAEGWTEAQALRLMESQSHPQAAPDQAAPQQAKVGNQSQTASVPTTVIQALGFDTNDPDVTNILRETPDAFEQTIKLANLANTRKGGQATTAQMQPAGNAARSVETRDSVVQELDKLVAKAGKSNTDWNRMAELQNRLRSME